MHRLNSFFALLLIFAFAIPLSVLQAASKKEAFPETISPDELKAEYAAAQAGGDKVRILIVPGHEPGYGGAQFGGFYERELAVALSNALAEKLRADPNLEVLVARGNDGWNRDFSAYFDRSMKSIEKFVSSAKKTFTKLVKRGKVEEKTEEVAHNAAPNDVALRLYGITKWSNDHDVDLMIHVHLNDEASHAENVPGNQSGFAIYVPDGQYGNARASKAVAEDILPRLKALNNVSTMPLEDAGIVEDQELIALGAYNTSEVPSLLIEYGYLYEGKFQHPEVVPAVLDDLAYATSRGVEDFFGVSSGGRYDSQVLPYRFTANVTATTTATSTVSSLDIYALQAALRSLKFYPPTATSLINCPVSGVLGSCTVDAVKAFQASKGLAQTGNLDLATRNALNAAFGIPSNPIAAETPAPAPAASAPVCAFPKPLSLDTESEDVTRLQTILAKDATLYPEGKITGYFGPATEAAVKKFQERHQIAKAGEPGYGSVGPRTAAALCK